MGISKDVPQHSAPDRKSRFTSPGKVEDEDLIKGNKPLDKLARAVQLSSADRDDLVAINEARTAKSPFPKSTFLPILRSDKASWSGKVGVLKAMGFSTNIEDFEQLIGRVNMLRSNFVKSKLTESGSSR